jgi:TetR/AcrR family transcriptional repressor of mexJK operon
MSQALHRPDADSPKRQAIVQAAAELFMQQGYGSVSMDAIARTAGVSKATLYAHFASKDALFAGIVGQGCRQSIQTRDFLPDDVTDLREALAGLAQRMVRFLMGPGPLAIYRTVVAEGTRFPELGRAFYDNGPGLFRQVFAAWLARQQAAGRLRKGDPELAADQFVAMLRGSAVYLRATLGLSPPPTDAEVDATIAGAVDSFLRAFGG